jgi:hypothetical protein
MKNNVFRTILIATAILFSTVCYGQLGGDEDEDPDTGIPIDGGITILMGTGIAYGTYRIFKKKS